MTKYTVTFSADDLHPHLDVLFLRKLESTPLQPSRCRLRVADGVLRIETAFRKGAAGLEIPARASDNVEFATLAARIAALKYVNGEVTLTVDEDSFTYKTSGGGSGAGTVWPGACVPKVAPPAAIGMESSVSLRALLDLTTPFGGGTVARCANRIMAGDARHAIAIDMASSTLDWIIARDATPAVRDYLDLVSGDVKLLADETKAGVATDQSWIVWPKSLAPEVAPLEPVAIADGRLTFAGESISTTAAWILAELAEDAWVDLFLDDGNATIGWSFGGETLRSDVMPYKGRSPHCHLRLNSQDLGLLFRRVRHDEVCLSFEAHDNAVILTSSESARIDGTPATIQRTATALVKASTSDAGGGLTAAPRQSGL